MTKRLTGYAALITAALCFLFTLQVGAKPGNGGKWRTVDGIVLSFGITNDVVTLDLSDGKPGGKYVIQYTADLNTWSLLTPAHLSGTGTFRYEYTSNGPHCFYRILNEP
jgi:hypothetical protein